MPAPMSVSDSVAMAGAVRRAGGGRRAARRSPDRQHSHEGASLGGWQKRGALVQAIGISRGGRNSKLHALTDGEGRPLRFLLTGGQVSDCRAADVLLDELACLVPASGGSGLR